jgi:hypothetical protein
VLGAFPTHVGLVWTDGSQNVSVTLEVFGASGNSLGQLSSGGIGDGAATGETAEDRFFGWVEPTGISSVHLSATAGSFEIDHLQYGGPLGEPPPPPIPGDHYLCYEAKPSKGAPDFEPLTVSLVNDFESGAADVKKPVALCNPADKNDEGIDDPDSHLVSFKIKPETKLAKTTLQIENQFGELLVETKEADRLLVPSSQSALVPVEPPVEPAIDHFECYTVRFRRGRRASSRSRRAWPTSSPPPGRST